eukprot:TRINITY_DN1518_c0_g1_i10.p1 TRINITY_DN1518_c0_g1~~TRINITY_DN1518_c0_g1_i10.p1  ORF type:complete len:350 (+),score=64.91 TRINITY_DN1518_c0_g1_i10:69-1118(+)
MSAATPHSARPHSARPYSASSRPSSSRPSSASSRTSLLSATVYGDSSRTPSIPPGYSGFIPNSQYHHGKTFGNLVRKADELQTDYTLMRDPQNFEEVPLEKSNAPKTGIRGYTGLCLKEERDEYPQFKITESPYLQTFTTRRSSSLKNRPTSAPNQSITSRSGSSNSTSQFAEAKQKAFQADYIRQVGGVSAWEDPSEKQKLYETRVPLRGSKKSGYAGHIPGERFETVDASTRQKVTDDKTIDAVSRTANASIDKEIPEYLCYRSMDPKVNPYAAQYMQQYPEPPTTPGRVIAPKTNKKDPPMNSWAAFVESREQAYVKPIIRPPTQVPLIQNHIRGYAGFVPGTRFA